MREVTAEEALLAVRAKAGDRAAVNELLRMALPALRTLVRRRIRGIRGAAPVHEEALQEALEHAWRALDRWDPALGSLATFVRDSALARASRVVSALGYAVRVPEIAPTRERTSRARRRWMRGTSSLDELVGEDNGWGPFTLGDVIAAPATDAAAILDARRILARLAPEDASLLLDVADGEPMALASPDLTREGAKKRYGAALRRAREVAAGMAPTPIKRRVQMLVRRFERLAGVLADGPLSISEVHRAIGAEVTPQAIGAWVRGLAAQGRLVTLRRGWQTVYALPAKEAA